MRKLFSLLFVFIFSIEYAALGSESSIERTKLEGIALAFNVYSKEHSGEVISKWEQIDEILNLEKFNYDMVRAHGYTVQDRYDFVSKELPLADRPESQVVMIRVIPLQYSGESSGSSDNQWRYVIYRAKEGHYHSTKLPENKIQEMLNKAGITITPKSGLPGVEIYRIAPPPPPTMNPADAAFLAQYPEYDPRRNPNAQRPPQSLIDEYKKTHNISTPAVTETPHEVTHVKEQAPIAIIEKTESTSNWKLWIGFAVVTLVAGTALWKYLQKNR